QSPELCADVVCARRRPCRRVSALPSSAREIEVSMRYISTRGNAPAIAFEDALLSGPAPDGGLYVPESWPQFSVGEFAALKGKANAEVASAVLANVADADWAEVCRRTAHEVYARFDHPDVAPLVEIAPRRHLLELFHGPTLAFKDFALQLVAPLMSEALKR